MRNALIVVVLAAAMVCSATALGQEQVTTRSLLLEMASLERLARSFPPGTRMIQYSSYDRNSRVEDGDTLGWWANGDNLYYMRQEKTARGTEYVMAEAEGPGALVRIWSALMRTGVLHEGMTLERAVDVLGKPTDLIHGRVSWYHNPGHRVHVYPDLSARDIDGILTDFRIGKR